MAYVDWRIEGDKISACNCDYGCPCEFNAPPTHGTCEGLEGMEIETGHFGDVRLDGVRIAATYHWPGAVHEGRGMCQTIIDKSASEAQREAIIKILSGEEQEPTTVFNIYGSTFETEFDTLFTAIDFACDMEARAAHLKVPGVFDMAIEPIRNPVTGAEHRARIDLPNGFEYRRAEMGSGRFTGTGDIKFEHDNCFGMLFHVAYGPQGVIET